MVEFKRFMGVWFSATILGTLLFGGASVWLFNEHKSIEQNNAQGIDENHFSVVYRGFIPGYSTAYPDYYIAINGLKDSQLRMYLQLFLQNQEASGYYFMIDKYQTPPTGWTINPSFLGLIGVDGTMTYTYSNIFRDKPASITEGELVETINLVVKAYYDSGYTNFYSQDNFTVTYHLIDRASAVWTVLEYDNFEDGTTEGWSGTGLSLSTSFYRSFRYSLKGDSYYGTGYSKTFTIVSPYVAGYLIAPIRSNLIPDFGVGIDGQTVFKLDTGMSANVWYQLTVPLHSGATSVGISMGNNGNSAQTYMDDVYVIAK